jgi:hypothetical protein
MKALASEDIGDELKVMASEDIGDELKALASEDIGDELKALASEDIGDEKFSFWYVFRTREPFGCTDLIDIQRKIPGTTTSRVTKTMRSSVFASIEISSLCPHY